MSSWTRNGWLIDIGSPTKILPGERDSAAVLVFHHNAACAAYESRIEALQGRLEAIREAVEQLSDCHNVALCDAIRELLNKGDGT